MKLLVSPESNDYAVCSTMVNRIWIINMRSKPVEIKRILTRHPHSGLPCIRHVPSEHKCCSQNEGAMVLQWFSHAVNHFQELFELIFTAGLESITQIVEFFVFKLT